VTRKLSKIAKRQIQAERQRLIAEFDQEIDRWSDGTCVPERKLKEFIYQMEADVNE
jgi:hypothetical protein